ncbi:MerR family transcriptional regulator [Lampropedia puyangensis]|uniref:MerR family transcriptional regulator n=1 Tax=Lampropedia puyangensis TaxID=1330072 RepID=A0A4S8F3W3_9BURK|nr:MerR family transcriptional regulator [Lampropedia puyangensis]THU02048.1 MerR family transcriptional regulator [Lampropedia puyangensis]
MSNYPQTPQFRIGEAAQKSGVSSANIRHYEREGLLPAAIRADNGYRFYSEQDIHLLRLIRLTRSLDMSADEIRQIIRLDGSTPQDCQQATDTITQHLSHVRARMAELGQLESRLQALLHACNGKQPTCQIIETLHQQAQTLDETHEPLSASARPRHV